MKFVCQKCHGDHPTATCPGLETEDSDMGLMGETVDRANEAAKEKRLIEQSKQNTRKRLHDAVDKFLEKAFHTNRGFEDGLYSTLKIEAGTTDGYATAMIEESHREDVT